MTVVTRQDLTPGYQATQSLHSLADFIIKYPQESHHWHCTSNYMVCLSAKDEAALEVLSTKLAKEEIKHTVFREPDLGNQITAIAIEPSERTRKLCSSFPLALRDYTNGLNKHSNLTT